MTKGHSPYGLIENAAMVIGGGRVDWVGAKESLPEKYRALEAHGLNGRLITPALIDCHTHLIFGGDRAREFEMRLNGASYEEIARAGGGILSTVAATRAADDDTLIAGALRRLDDLIADGVSIVEIKSGYGLTVDDEIRMLRIARKLGALRPVTIVTTWLAAHALPDEYSGRADDYIDDVVIEGLKCAHHEGLVDAVDGFCENIGFSREQIERVFIAASALGLRVKVHAEQLSDQKGALLASKYNALSADHLEYLHEDDVPTFGASNAAAVLLPGAFYTLKENKLPPIEALRRQNIDIAIATDCNPGSSPISSLLTVMNMASSFFGLTPEEVLAGVTRNAAKALGLDGKRGTIVDGSIADIAIWSVDHPSALSYWIGRSPLYKSIFHGHHA